MSAVVAGLLCLLLGSIPFSYLVGRFGRGVDVRRVGSGNVGATNVARTAGLGFGAISLLLDLGKGVLAVLIVNTLPAPIWLSGLAVIGHDWSPFLRFRGGKGVATTLGLLLMSAWPAALIAIGVWLVSAGISRMVSVASILLLVTGPSALVALGARPELVGLFAGLACLGIAQHRSNLARLFSGSEHHIG